ncbi:glycoside hydrolase family 6 protein [Conyzicola sp.]|uniref:glycoside hydrolase family 6 protein n=1 Tax=Conyzicola sp. TaxID=1969404 RepID=UPI0039897C2A
MAQTAVPRRSPWRIDPKGVIAIIVAGALVIAAGGSYLWNTVLSDLPLSSGTSNPLGSGQFYVNPDSAAVRAAADPTLSAADAADILALSTTPQAIWLVPEAHPTASIGSYVSEIVAAETASDTIATFVVYGIPERDCGNFSAGGLTAAEYPLWLDAVAAGIGDTTTAVVLEPDSLSLAEECGNTDSRVATTHDAITRFEATAAVIYLDGGHSNWHPVEQTAALLARAGVDRVRGFATNVSNYNTTDDEVAYAERLSALTGDAHYVVDTGRNGNGSNGEWCNPAGSALGSPPAAFAEGHLDAELWIKTPGESDGECNGGPGAGEWWNAGALALVRN